MREVLGNLSRVGLFLPSRQGSSVEDIATGTIDRTQAVWQKLDDDPVEKTAANEPTNRVIAPAVWQGQLLNCTQTEKPEQYGLFC